MTDELRTIAEQLARDAGEIALSGRRSHPRLAADTKSSATDLVTEFDRAAESAIVDWLRTNRPDDAIVGEEGTDDTGTSGLEWHIDPIDGTTNFVYDLPAWAASVGVRRDGVALAGAVFAPALDEMFSAAAGDGATLNGSPIRCSSTDDLAIALVATGFGFSAERRREQALALAGFMDRIRDIRRYGAASIDLCYVACGRVDAYYELGLNSWDMLAGELIAREAGALSSDFAGASPRPDELLVAAPGLHSAMIGLLPTPSRWNDRTE